MIIIKKYFISISLTIISILITTLFISIFYYFNLLNNKTTTILLYLFSSVSIFIGALYLGKNTNNKGYLSGIKLFLIIFTIMFFLSLIFKINYSIQTLIYYFILLTFSTLGSTIGINYKKEATD